MCIRDSVTPLPKLSVNAPSPPFPLPPLLGDIPSSVGHLSYAKSSSPGNHGMPVAIRVRRRDVLRKGESIAESGPRCDDAEEARRRPALNLRWGTGAEGGACLLYTSPSPRDS